MQISTLGPIDVRVGDTEVELGGRLRRLLAALVIAPEATVPVDRLVDIVWAGNPPPAAETTLRSYVTRLRKALGDDHSQRVVAKSPGYALLLSESTVDHVLFEAELTEATRLQLVSADHEAARLLAATLKRWRGRAFEEFAEEDWARAESVRLEALADEARLRLVESSIQLGDQGTAIAHARSLIALQPLADRPRGLLMRALAAEGRQAEALREFGAYRAFLGDETGLEPSKELVDLERRIVQNDETSGRQVNAARSYEIAERLFVDSIGAVHRASQPALGRDVAIRIVQSHIADHEEFIRRFHFEAAAAARLQHPAIVPLFDFWREPGAAFLVTPHMPSGRLRQLVEAGIRFDDDQLAGEIRRLAAAIDTAHREGTTHGRINTQSVAIGDAGEFYLTDFGIIGVDRAEGSDLVTSAGSPLNENIRRDLLALGRLTTELLAQPDAILDIDLDVLTTATEVTDHLLRSVGSDDRLVQEEVVANPYVGLRPFDEVSSDQFYGRSALTGNIIDHIRAHRLVTVVGPSGSGKSSIVRAGVLPALRRDAIDCSTNWLTATMVPGTDPVAEFATALEQIAVTPAVRWRAQLAQPRGFAEAIRAVLPDSETPLLLLIDQFEEVFTNAESAPAQHFLSELCAVLDDTSLNVRIVATLRADHYDAPLRHVGFAPHFADSTIDVIPMTSEEISAAIVAPAASVGVDVEPALVVELVAQMTADPAALPLLQFTLTELFERSDRRLLEATHLDELGGIGGAVAFRADHIVACGTADEARSARDVFARLVSITELRSDIRRRAFLHEFAEDEAATSQIAKFIEARLLSTDRDETSRLPTIEVAHEALLRDWPRLRTWIDEDRNDLVALGRVTASAAGWERSGRDEADLARGFRLEAASSVHGRHPDWLTPTEADWLAESERAANDEQNAQLSIRRREHRNLRRLRSLFGVTAFLLVVSLVAVAGALVLRSRATRNATAARSATEDAQIERLIALSASEYSVAPDRSILLALEANRRRDNNATRTAVHRAIATEPRISSFAPSEITGLSETTISRDGSTAVSASALDARLVWHDARSGAVANTAPPLGAGAHRIALAADGQRAGVVLTNGTVVFVESDGTVVSEVEIPGDEIAIDEHGHTAVVSLLFGDGVVVIDIERGEAVTTFELAGGAISTGVGLSADGRTAAIAMTQQFFADNDADRIELFDARSGESITQFRSPDGLATSFDFGADGTAVTGHGNGMVNVFLDTAGATQTVRFRAAQQRIDEVAIGETGVLTSAESIRAWSFDGQPTSPEIEVPGEIDAVRQTGPITAFASLRTGGHFLIDQSAPTIVTGVQPVELVAQLSPNLGFYTTPSSDYSTSLFRRFDDGSVAWSFDLSEIHPNGTGPPFYSANGKWVVTYDEGTDVVAITEIGGEVQHLIELADVKQLLLGVDPGRIPISLRPGPTGDRYFVALSDGTGQNMVAWMDSTKPSVIAGPLVVDGVGPVLTLAGDLVIVGGVSTPTALFQPELDAAPMLINGTEGMAPYHQDPTSGLVVLGGEGGKVGLLDPATGAYRPIAGGSAITYAAAFSPDGATLGTATIEDGVQLFDVESLDPVGISVSPGIFDETSGAGMRWDPDGNGVWIVTPGRLARVSTSPDDWRATACSIVSRSLTQAEWDKFVEPGSPPIDPCIDEGR